MSWNIKLESPEEAALAIAEINKRHPDDILPGEHRLLIDQAQNNFMEWDKRLWDRNGFTIAHNHLMSENSRQWGRVPGLNTGNGQFESRMDLHLVLAYGMDKYPDDQDWWKDDAKFYRFLRAHPELDGRPGKNNARGEKHMTVANILF